MLRLKVYHFIPNGKALELQNWYADRACAINCYGQAYEVRFLHACGGIPCRPHPAATQLIFADI